jgi:hypothetical protein
VRELPAEALFEAWVPLKRPADRGGPLWYRVGYAVPTEDGEELFVELSATPRSGDLELKLPKERRREELAARPDNLSRHPTMLAYTTDGVRIGGVFRHRDDQGLRVRLFARPLDGMMVLKPARTPEELAAANEVRSDQES